MDTSNLYIGEIKRLVNFDGKYAIRKVKVTVLKRIDYKLYKDIFDKKVYGFNFTDMDTGYIEEGTMIKYDSLYKGRFKTKGKIKRDINFH